MGTTDNTLRLFHIINEQWENRDIYSFEAWLADLGIEWRELDNHITDAPAGTVAVWEGPGFEDESRQACWIVPAAVAARLLADNDGREFAPIE